MLHRIEKPSTDRAVHRTLLLAVCAAGLLASCAVSRPKAATASEPPSTEIPASLQRDPAAGACPFNQYAFDAQTGASQWFALVSDAPNSVTSHYVSLGQPGRGVLEAGGKPLLFDGNHLDSGPVYLFAIAWTDTGINAFPRSYFKDPDEVQPRGLGRHCFDLRNTWLYIRAKPEDLDLHGGKLVFWFQNYDTYARKVVNYAFTSSPIDVLLEPGEFRNTCIKLTDSLDDWTCLASNKTDRRLVYGCSTNRTRFRHVLSHVNNDIGLIVIHNKLPDGSIAPTTKPPDGRLLISDIGIWPAYPGDDKCGQPRLSGKDSLGR